MKKHFVKTLHVTWWLAYLAFFCGVYLLPDKSQPEELPELAALALLTGMIAFYLTYLWLFKRFLQRKNWLQLLMISVLIIITSGLPGAAYICLGVYWLFGIRAEAAVWLSLWSGFGFIALLNAGMGFLLRGFLAWYRQKNQAAQELHQLRIHLQPHFLFNTLNNIDILIIDDQAMASAYLQKLSGLLRYLLYDSQAPKVLLSKEVGFIRDYLQLQDLRTSNVEYATFEVEGEAGDKKIAPLLFIPFIENAFKHTLNKKVANAIRIRLTIEPGKLDFYCMNKIGEQTDVYKEGGLGLGIARKQLELLYGDTFSLETGAKDGIFTVQLNLNRPC
jgi:two-component system LytT family sensor kinase